MFQKLLSCKKNIVKCKRLVYNGFKGIDSDGLVLSEGEVFCELIPLT